MKFLLTSAASRTRASTPRWSTSWANRWPSRVLSVFLPRLTPCQAALALAWNFITGREPRTPMCELGWKSLGVLELTALPQHR